MFCARPHTGVHARVAVLTVLATVHAYTAATATRRSAGGTHAVTVGGLHTPGPPHGSAPVTHDVRGVIGACSIVLLFAAVAMCSKRVGSGREAELEAELERLRNRVDELETENAQLKKQDGEVDVQPDSTGPGYGCPFLRWCPTLSYRPLSYHALTKVTMPKPVLQLPTCVSPARVLPGT